MPATDVLKRLGLSGGNERSAGSGAISSLGGLSGSADIVSLRQVRDSQQPITAADLRRRADTDFAAQLRGLLESVSAHPDDEVTRTVVITGVARPEEASVVAASLATMAAIGGYRTALVDGNVGSPGLHTLFGLSNERGLSNLLREQYSAANLLQSSSVPNLAVMPAGPNIDGSAGLLLQQRILHRVSPVFKAYDFVIVDCATLPPGLVATAAEGATDVIVAAKRHASSLIALRDMLDALRQDGTDNASVLILE